MCTLYNEPGVRVLPPHGWGGGHFAIFPCVMVDSWRLAFMEAGSWDDLYPVNKEANHRIW